MKKITLKDIAKHFSVSVSTVSKALSDSYEIGETTKQKIKEYAKLKNYKRNYNALSLKNSKTKAIGVIIPDMLDYFFAQVLKGIEKTALVNEYKIITCITNESLTKEIEIIEMLSNGSVDGFIVSISEETELKKTFKHFNDTIGYGMPIVMFDRVVNEVNCDKVITDNFKAVQNAVKRLVKSGCKYIGFASCSPHLEDNNMMFKGYLKALENENLKVDKNLILNSREDHYSKYQAALLPLFDNKMDAIITTSESLAIAAMKIAQSKGLKIPEDFSVIGFSNGILARHSSPKLTTISQHGEIMGEIAAKMLFNKLENEDNQDITTKILETDIVERDSTLLAN